MDFFQTVTAFKDVVLAAAGAVTAYVAVSGIKKWRNELEGKAGFESARSLARATYRLRDEVASFRSPLITNDEFPAHYFDNSKRSSQDETQAYAYVYKNRWSPVKAAVAEFDTQALEAEALWGSAIRIQTDALRVCVSELRSAIDAILGDKLSGGEDFKADREVGKLMRGRVHASPGSNENPLSQKINSAVKEIENSLRGHLGRN